MQKLYKKGKTRRASKSVAYSLMTSSLLLFFLFIFIFFSLPSYAKDLGKVGQVYPIKEMDMLDFIQSRLNEMKERGKLEKINKKMIEAGKKRADRPTAVKNISPAKKYRKWFVDPSVTFEKDITDAEGKIIVKAGTVINPLKTISLKTALIFFDGDNKSQVTWVKKWIEKKSKNKKKQSHGRYKLILVNGSVAEQSKILKKKIYFDQHGRLTSKFKIKHTPVMVTQEKMQFKVEELAS